MEYKMKRFTLALTLLAMGAMVISPKAEAISFSETQELLVAQAKPVTKPQFKKFNSQIRKLKPANTRGNSQVDALLEQGFSLLEQEDYRGAIRVFTQVLKIDRRNAAAYAGRGIAYLNLQDYRRAKADFDQAIRIAPNNGWLYLYRGIARLGLKDTNGAASDIRKAQQIAEQTGDEELAQAIQQLLEELGAAG